MSVRILDRVVETKLERRGKGVDGDPIRIITQYWDEFGNFLAEAEDPWAKKDEPTGSKAEP